MAKQSGLHQLRGKVGDHSYYRQSGVASGLVRSINQGLSARVKNDAAFANTRLNNAEFGQACRMAAVLGQLIYPKFRPMMLTFSQAKMAADLLEAIKVSSGSWGQRNLSANDVDTFLGALNRVRKNNPDDYGILLSSSQSGTITLTEDTLAFDAKLAAIGADGYRINILCCSPWMGTYDAATNKYAPSYPLVNTIEGDLDTDQRTFTETISYRPDPQAGWPAFVPKFLVLVVMPYRTINETAHILQEHCTYITVDPSTL